MLIQVDLEKVSPDEKMRIIKSITRPEDLARLSNDYPPYRILVAKNPHTSLRTLWKLSKDKEDDVREAVAKNPKASAPLLAKLAEDSYWKVRLAVASNENSRADTLARLYVSPVPSCCYSYGEDEEREGLIRIAVSRNPSADVCNLKNDFLEVVRANVAKHPNMDSVSLSSMYKPDEKYSVLRNLARNPNTPKDTLKELGKWSHPSYGNLHLYLAGNPSTPVDLLESYANECSFKNGSRDEQELEEALAGNPSSPEKILVKLANSSCVEVLLKVAEHNNTPWRILVRFINNREYRLHTVSSRAAVKLAMRRRALQNSDKDSQQEE